MICHLLKRPQFKALRFIVMSRWFPAHIGSFTPPSCEYHLIITDHEDEDLVDSTHNQLPMLIEQNLKLFSPNIIGEYLDDHISIKPFYADAPMAKRSNVNIFMFWTRLFKLGDQMFRHTILRWTRKKNKSPGGERTWRYAYFTAPHYSNIFFLCLRCFQS